MLWKSPRGSTSIPLFPQRLPRGRASAVDCGSSPPRAQERRGRTGTDARQPVPQTPTRGSAELGAGPRSLSAPGRRAPTPLPPGTRHGSRAACPLAGLRGPRLPRPRGARSPQEPGRGDSQGLQVLELLQLLRVVSPPLLLPAALQLLLRRLPRPPRAPGLRVAAPRPGRHRGPRGPGGGEDGTSSAPRPPGPAAPPPAAAGR